MKKLMVIFGVLMISASCSSTSKTGYREVASVGNCGIEKHPSTDVYRVMKSNVPYNKYWYSHSDAKSLLKRIEQNGSCK